MNQNPWRIHGANVYTHVWLRYEGFSLGKSMAQAPLLHDAICMAHSWRKCSYR
jgi:hypothetical protein